MGYKYGVWYVYSKNVFNTKHMSHFTVACLMSKKDMYDLYYSIRDILDYTNVAIVNCKDAKVFDSNMYKEDNNNLYSWGYHGKILHWDILKSILVKYKCNYTDNANPQILMSMKISNMNHRLGFYPSSTSINRQYASPQHP